MLNGLELFLSQYPNIINTLVAIGTIGAVILSLYFSNLTLKPKIKANVYCSELLIPDINGTYQTNEEKYYVSLSVSNVGYVPIFLYYFGCFSWFFPFRRLAWMQNALQPIFNDKCFEIEPHKCYSFVLCEQDFLVKELVKLVKEKKYPFLLLKFLKFKIRTNNILINAKIDKKLLNSILDKVYEGCL